MIIIIILWYDYLAIHFINKFVDKCHSNIKTHTDSILLKNQQKLFINGY